jgi:hypothetical protein
VTGVGGSAIVRAADDVPTRSRRERRHGNRERRGEQERKRHAVATGHRGLLFGG